MSLTFEEFLLVLRVASIAVLYFFILQVVLVARKDLSDAQKAQRVQSAKAIIGHLIVVDSGPVHLAPGESLNIVSPTALGRDPNNDVVLDSANVSSVHARIYFRNKSLWVEDMGSTNGTYLNDQKLQPNTPVAVRPRDMLRLGDVLFRIVP
jgi:pSer/pThr/pTyr-binding forkhead associated (FHA) protein